MKNLKIPLITYGTSMNHINLKQIEESPQKCIQIQQEDSSFNIYSCNYLELCRNILINKNLIFLIQYEELIEFDVKLQNIFNLIQFAKVKKVLCFIVLSEPIKKCQWKLDIIKKYIEISVQNFNFANYNQPNYNIQSIQSQQSICNQLNFFQTTPKDPDFNNLNNTLMQIISRNKNELEVALIQGMVILSDSCYLENQKADNKPIQIIEIEGQLNYINSNEDRQVLRIKISDDSELKDQCFISNNIFQVKQYSPQILFSPQFDSIEQRQKFYLNYRNSSDWSVIIRNDQYDIKKLEFDSFSDNNLKLTLNTSKFIYTSKFSTNNSFNINCQILIINKHTEEIITFGLIEQDNFEIHFTHNKHSKQELLQMEQFYLPINDEDIIQNIDRGELQQKGNHIIKCRICMERQSDTLLIPCGHLRYCFDCSIENQDCLYCETKIQSRKKLQIKQIDQNKNDLIKDLMWRHQDLLKCSFQQNLNIEQNLKINEMQNQINFNQYYCQKCDKSKGTQFVNCHQNHLITYCLECSKLINKCEFINCNQNIMQKGQIKFRFQE
ncbi:unnamed protein product [Paramecium pentaurelia]|uniref:RING-type domain-containing protein n=1 Tax=Paramecium pentaurelia TaxID=43138 RepID=A0A8S1Y442_9CILI|nr:unnamed protein product [Paramecium pentaurelia]